MPGFHHSVAVLPLPFRCSAVVKFRSVKIMYENSVNGKKIRNGSGTAGTATVYGNGSG